jgi:hypothetical protein
VALRELSRHEILQAVAEYDRLGQDRFLEKYGFGAARSYRLLLDGKPYDSKAIVGAAHGFLPGQEPLAAADFSGGAATVGRLLSRLGFQVTQTASGLREHPRPHCPVAALYHAGLWDLGGPRPVPPAHGDAPLRWFARNQPASGLPAPVYNLALHRGAAGDAAGGLRRDLGLQRVSGRVG